MSDLPEDLRTAIFEIRDLIRLMAEPAVAERDRALREELRQIVGKSSTKAKSVYLMDGTRTQKQIHEETSVHKGNLSTLVKQLRQSGLVVDEPGGPRLTISIPATFFDSNGDSD